MNINDLYRDYVSSTVEYDQWSTLYTTIHFVIFLLVFALLLFTFISNRTNKAIIFTGLLGLAIAVSGAMGGFEKILNPTAVNAPAQLSNEMVDEIDRQIKDTYRVDSVSFFYAHEEENMNEEMKEDRIKTNKIWGPLSFSDTKRGMNDLNFVNVRVGDNAYKYYIEADESGNVQLVKNSISDAPDPSTLRK